MLEDFMWTICIDTRACGLPRPDDICGKGGDTVALYHSPLSSPSDLLPDGAPVTAILLCAETNRQKVVQKQQPIDIHVAKA